MYRFTSYMKLWAAHPPELAVDRVNFFDQDVQNGVTDPLQTHLCFSIFIWNLNVIGKLNTYISKLRRPAINVIHNWAAGCDPGPHLNKQGNPDMSLIRTLKQTTSHSRAQPPLQPVWSPGQFHPCGQTGPESDRPAGTWTFLDSGHNLPSNGCNSKTSGCGLETQTLDYLQRAIISSCDCFAKQPWLK